MIKKTEYVDMTGKAYWAKVYQLDNYNGASRWILDFFPNEEALKKFKDLGIQKKLLENENGTYFRPIRPESKLITNRVVYFTPPIIYNKDGSVAVGYYNEDDNLVRSYDDKDKKIVKRGENILIGNGSDVTITLCVYPTAKGVGNRLESVKILDLVEYKAPANDKTLPPPAAVGVNW